MGALVVDTSVQERVLIILAKDATINKLVDMFAERQSEYVNRIKDLECRLLKQPAVEWVSVSDVAEAKGLSSDAVRKQLENGEFEDGVDFKKPNGRIQINQGAVERIQRKRRNSDA